MGNKIMQSYTDNIVPVFEKNFEAAEQIINDMIDSLLRNAKRTYAVVEGRKAIQNVFKESNDILVDNYKKLFDQSSEIWKMLMDKSINKSKEVADQLLDSLSQIDVEMAKIYENFAGQIKQMIDSGFAPAYIKDILNEPFDIMVERFNNISRFVKTQQFGKDIMTDLKDIQNSTLINSLIDTFAKRGVSGELTSKLREVQTVMTDNVYKFDDYYKFESMNIQHRLNNAKMFSDEYITAAKDLYNLEKERITILTEMYESGLIGQMGDLSGVMVDAVRRVFESREFEYSLASKIKGFESKDIFNTVYEEMKSIPEAMGVNSELENLAKSMNSASDPWEMWYDYTYKVVLQKLRNTTEGSDKWFEAQDELFDLLTEKANRAKDKAENSMDNLEKLFGSIDETLKMRLAEERKSAKGDTYFVDTSKLGIDRYMMKDLADKIRANDPDASRLLEDLKRKMLGVSK
jgi:ElaB/YqjD/DUF883 family membrane-anchored ribosome-binding protein